MIFTIFPEKIYEKMGWKYGITSETTIPGISSEPSETGARKLAGYLANRPAFWPASYPAARLAFVRPAGYLAS